MTLPDIDVELSEEDLAIRETCHKFALEVLRPAGRELDRLQDPARVIASDSLLWDVFRQYRELGLGAVFADTTIDSLAKARMMCVINEELSWGDVGLAISLGLSHFHQPWIEQSGDAALHARFCDPARPTIGCWALTEPDHGSDTVAFTEPCFTNPAVRANCIARKDGEHYVINGQKAAWVSNGSIADIAVLFCTLDPAQGFSGGAVILVPLDAPGVDRPAPLDKIGQRSLNQGQMFFSDVRVPASHLVVGPEFYPMALEGMLCHGNAGMSQLFIGVARAALDHALEYAEQRVQGGLPISRHQSVRARLFKMFMKVEAARSLTRRTALYLAVKPPSIQHAIAAKVFATNTAFEVASEALQIFGGNGLTREYPVEKLLRDARASMIEDGCNEMLGLIAGARLQGH
ncbi:MAG: acyl-CoA/acyl-ACP dehydrogenase [Gammaproteobacteria bacterium]|jgi:alkylation response protein AidB-like acyl-CoA dehydrogenase|nr:acyl-CoA/acyl-ACP dehydrogenase [Gammaproteobacteria bacterium]MBP6052730.1 acyl-CoA/acyl-ACP dehydrogenase [Pseudomonadales bacterium]MBK7168673.1 acyl-CoA/acyl-ACP dehydrogenase [Gammaproteobacteria bacterium]MBK7520259.1 acyl-CoA/acyl-ACP dehydrogenase [Gammaproteobacteria bacterium]MBK7729519.1 acyl-CoA/acyl-ACP dehydrogenase [Gammaproteobacteria bacterium]